MFENFFNLCFLNHICIFSMVHVKNQRVILLDIFSFKQCFKILYEYFSEQLILSDLLPVHCLLFLC